MVGAGRNGGQAVEEGACAPRSYDQERHCTEGAIPREEDCDDQGEEGEDDDKGERADPLPRHNPQGYCHAHPGERPPDHASQEVMENRRIV